MFRSLTRAFLCALVGLLCLTTACALPSPSPLPSSTPAPASTAAPTPSPLPTPISPQLGHVDVEDGDQLVRDIIPQLSREFGLSVAAAESVLATPIASPLIAADLTDFRRMEGVIPPGRYLVTPGSDPTDLVRTWILAAEARYARLAAEAATSNALSAPDRLALASMVEAECLANEHYDEVSTVFQNRLAGKWLLRSCVTAEYALGYQRPYLTTADRKVASPYDTYVVSGLPKGPICAVDDGSLSAAIARPLPRALYYFYYDYIRDDMFFFTGDKAGYDAFRAAATASREGYVAHSDIPAEAYVDKQVLFGHGPVDRLTWSNGS